MKTIQITQPCPMLLFRMSQNGNTFSCKSCNKHVVDFRNKTADEIAAEMTPDTCGIFNVSQLSAQPRLSFFNRGVFSFLVMLSFLGFNVSPLNAAPKQIAHESEISQSTLKTKKKLYKPRKRKKRKQQRTMGYGKML